MCVYIIIHGTATVTRAFCDNLVMRNFQFGNKKYTNWKLVTRKSEIGNDKSANWKSVTRNFQIGNGKG